MKMIVHLDENMFCLVESGVKDVEARVNDLKRRKLKIGDKLIFLKRPENDEKIERRVKALDYYDTFADLVNYYEMERLYFKECSKEKYVEEMKRFYSLEEVKNYGVVAITFE